MKVWYLILLFFCAQFLAEPFHTQNPEERAEIQKKQVKCLPDDPRWNTLDNSWGARYLRYIACVECCYAPSWPNTLLFNGPRELCIWIGGDAAKGTFENWSRECEAKCG